MALNKALNPDAREASDPDRAPHAARRVSFVLGSSSMTLRHIACAFASLLFGAASFAQTSASTIVGRWQYIQPPDSEGEVLDISLVGERYTGIMNGLERAGDHGLFYYVLEVSDLAIGADESVRFTVGPRSFFRQRPLRR